MMIKWTVFTILIVNLLGRSVEAKSMKINPEMMTKIGFQYAEDAFGLPSGALERMKGLVPAMRSVVVAQLKLFITNAVETYQDFRTVIQISRNLLPDKITGISNPEEIKGVFLEGAYCMRTAITQTSSEHLQILYASYEEFEKLAMKMVGYFNEMAGCPEDDMDCPVKIVANCNDDEKSHSDFVNQKMDSFANIKKSHDDMINKCAQFS